MDEEMVELFGHLNELMDSGDYITLKNELKEEQPANVAEYLEELTAEKRLFVFRLLAKDMAAEVFSFMERS